MAQSLLITKQSGDFFSLDLTVDAVVYPQVISDQNRILIRGTLCDFKTANGANIIKKQNIDVTEITLIDSGTFTFSSSFELLIKLKSVGFFDGLSSGSGGGSGADRFDNLIDTFKYIGNNGYVPVVNTSQQKLVATPFYNYRTFLDLEDTPSAFTPNKIVVVNSSGTGLIFIDQPETPETFLNAYGWLYYEDDLTKTTPISVSADTSTLLTNDGEGSETNLTFNPYSVTGVFNVGTGQMYFGQLSSGDMVKYRVALKITTLSVDTQYSIRLRAGIGSGNEKIYDVFSDFQEDIETFNRTVFNEVFIEDDLIDYPSQFEILSNKAIEVEVGGFLFDILRKGINIVDVESPDHNDLTGLNVGDYLHFTSAEKISALNRLESVVAGTNITIDDTDPLNPIINSSGGGGDQDNKENIYTVTLSDIGAADFNDDVQDKLMTYIQANPLLFPDRVTDGIYSYEVVEGSPEIPGGLYIETSDIVAFETDNGFDVTDVAEWNTLFSSTFSSVEVTGDNIALLGTDAISSIFGTFGSSLTKLTTYGQSTFSFCTLSGSTLTIAPAFYGSNEIEVLQIYTNNISEIVGDELNGKTSLAALGLAENNLTITELNKWTDWATNEAPDDGNIVITDNAEDLSTSTTVIALEAKGWTVTN